MKAFFRSPIVQATLTALVAGYMLLIKHTTRWRVFNGEAADAQWAAKGGFIGVFWHRALLMGPGALKGRTRRVSIVISLSPDGAFIARSSELLGLNVIRGSARNKRKTKSKGGVAAARASRDAVDAGDMVAMTPDGPRGPRMRANFAALRLAQTTQAPIIGVAMTTRRRFVLNSWDRFIVPLPFSRGAVVWFGPFAPPAPDADAETLEATRQRLETALLEAAAAAETAVGAAVTPPAPIAGASAPKPPPASRYTTHAAAPESDAADEGARP